MNDKCNQIIILIEDKIGEVKGQFDACDDKLDHHLLVKIEAYREIIKLIKNIGGN